MPQYERAEMIDFLSGLASGDLPTRDVVEVMVDRTALVFADLLEVLAPSDIANVGHGGALQSFRRRLRQALHEILDERGGAWWARRWDPEFDPDHKFLSFLQLAYLSHPELYLPLGYDEVRYGAPPIVDPTVSASAAGINLEAAEEAGPELVSLYATGRLPWQSTQYRTPDGVWHDYEGVFDRLIPLGRSFRATIADLLTPGEAADALRAAVRSSEDIGDDLTLTPGEAVAGALGALKSAAGAPSAHTAFAVYPALGVPSGRTESQIQHATRLLLMELHRTKRPLRELSWRTLEEIVAELLRGMGLAVSLTPRSRDGGRDVVARGELIPGEPCLLAVEVKHMNVVPVGELRDALWANRHFPALLLATSGRFGAGVYRERRGPETGLRLFLKDGIGLSQWISEYVARELRRVAGER